MSAQRPVCPRPDMTRRFTTTPDRNFAALAFSKFADLRNPAAAARPVLWVLPNFQGRPPALKGTTHAPRFRTIQVSPKDPVGASAATSACGKLAQRVSEE